MTEHFLPGKDASLETSIANLQARLAGAGFRLEETGWLNPIAGVWSVHLRDADCGLLYSNGKGASELAARASALGEFFERAACGHFWSQYYLGESVSSAPFVLDPREKWFELDGEFEWPEGLLTPELQDFYNPEGEIDPEALVELNTGNYDRGICALPFTRQRDGRAVYFPVNLLGNLYVSNGMAAGNSEAEARTQALSEILERHVKFRVLREGLCLPEVPEASIARHPELQAGISALREAGFGLMVRDASLGGRFPVVALALLNPRDQGCYLSFGAHPCFEVALERALTELLQGRALDALDGFPPPTLDLEEVASTPNLESHFVDSTGLVHWNFLRAEPDFPFCEWDFTGSTSQDFERLCEIVHAEEREVYVLDYTHLGGYACRILVPGLSEIYPIDELEHDNNSIGNDLRPSILQLDQLDEEQCGDLLDALHDIGLDDQRPVSIAIGLAPEPGSIWEDLRVGELKLLIALALGEEDAIAEGLEWVLGFGQISPARLSLYRCIANLLEFEDDVPYVDALLGLYGPETLDRARRHLTGEERFLDLKAPGMALEGCTLHRSLLAAFDKVQARNR